MDAQILAATLATLAAVFAGLNGGAFTVDDIQNTTSIPETTTESNSLIPKIPFLERLTQKPEPENPVNAEITLPKNTETPFKNAEITLNQNALNTSKTQISSPSQITLENTTGKITLGNKTTLEAETKQINTNQVTIKQKTKVNSEITQTILIKNTGKIALKYRNASIKPTPDSDFGINTENKKLDTNSYKGDMEINPETRTLTLNGKVDKLTAGQYTLNN